MREAMPAERYTLAEGMLDPWRGELLVGERINLTWLDETRCWFRQTRAGRQQYLMADAAEGWVRPAFDHELLTQALSRATSAHVDARRLDLQDLHLHHGRMTFDHQGRSWHFDPESQTLAEAGPSPVPRRSTVEATASGWRAFTRDHNLWAHLPTTGEERQLTRDGSPSSPVGEEPDAAGDRHLLSLLDAGPKPPRALWSPDGTRLLTHVIDQSEVRSQLLLDHDPPAGGRSARHEYRYALPGENVPTGRWRVVDLHGAALEVDMPFPVPYLSPVTLRQVWWDPSGEAIYWVRHTRDRKRASLVEIEPSTGRARTLVEETGEHRVDVGPYLFDPPLVAVSREAGRVAWFSQRDGNDRLYAYDLASAELCSVLTPADWRVREILHADETGLHLAVSFTDAADPYVRSWARVGWGGEAAVVLRDDVDHALSSSPGGHYMLDGGSDAGTPPLWQIRDAAGEVRVRLGQADVTALTDLGWQPPERITVTSADGSETLFGVLHRPFDFDPHQVYPLIDHMYPGPQVCRSSPAFYGAHRDQEAAALAALGFVVLTLDGRGTPGRGRRFLDHSLGDLGTAGCLEDHVAALRQLTARHSWIDPARVGAVGHSAGGFAAAKAALTLPDVYSVAVALAGNHDNRIYNAAWGEAFDDAGDGVDGRSSNLGPVHLRARLLLGHGGLDDNVLPDHTLRLVNRLVEADHDVDLMILPRAEHTFYRYEHHVLRRTWDYLVHHLLRREPPAYRLRPLPPSPELLSRVFDG